MMDCMYPSEPKRGATDSIDFLIASPKASCCTESAPVQPVSPDPPADDAFTRLLHRLEPDPDALSTEAEPRVDRLGGPPVFDDSTLDKHSAEKIDPVGRHRSGKHKRVVRGINPITAAWTDGDRVVPCGARPFDKARDGPTKDDHLLAMLKQAKARGLEPSCVAFDRRYSGLEDRKAVRACDRTFLTRLEFNRKVDLDRQGCRAVAEVEIAAGGTIVHLEGFGSTRVFKVVSRDGDVEYWATDDLE